MPRKVWASSGVFLLIFPMVISCGGGGSGPSTGETTSAVVTPGIPGSPKPGAQGSPIRVPAFGPLETKPLGALKAAVEYLLKNDPRACGDGTLCVKVRYVVTSKNDDKCQVEKVQPTATIDRNATLTVTISCQENAKTTMPGETSTGGRTTTTTRS